MNPRARADDDDETSETSDTRSDEDAFEDVRATDGFEDEEIDEDDLKKRVAEVRAQLIYEIRLCGAGRVAPAVHYAEAGRSAMR